MDVQHADQHLEVTPDGDGWLCAEPKYKHLIGKNRQLDTRIALAIEEDQRVVGRGFLRLWPDGDVEYIPAREMIICSNDQPAHTMDNDQAIHELHRVFQFPPDTFPHWPSILDAARALMTVPTPVWLTCPHCKLPHIDEGDFKTHPHTTHSCQGCGLTWRPAVAATVGVRFLPGFKNKADSNNPLAPGDGILEQTSYPNEDGSFTVVRISHHKGCSARKDCECSPIRTTDRHYPSPL